MLGNPPLLTLFLHVQLPVFFIGPLLLFETMLVKVGVLGGGAFLQIGALAREFDLHSLVVNFYDAKILSLADLKMWRV
jgi:hypothetical protein